MYKNNDQEMTDKFKGLSVSFSYEKSEGVTIREDFYGLMKSASIDVSELIKEKINSAIKEISINDEEEINKIFVLMSEESFTALGEAYEDLSIDKQYILVSPKIIPGQIKVLLMTQDDTLYHDHETKIQIPPSIEKS
ncbi:MAG: hypothetical protein ACOCUD_05170 [Bacillota bacterium]